MKLQIIYQHEALQIPGAFEQKALQQALKQKNYRLAKFTTVYISYGA